ncbi:hypothetical protein EXIGLDRAFT_780678 [Exidia glandulosa HHB12029]|uniref:DNA 3'-5' helicase n=1 Tax=Exidia glandulosa HHB12029 TaxID=1314781 RepID=A0A165BHK8_EXIGL|nr:hypothetical protein EXIGLDRAFT_780678 [Exidia glandulosa HHB12029]
MAGRLLNAWAWSQHKFLARSYEFRLARVTPRVLGLPESNATVIEPAPGVAPSARASRSARASNASINANTSTARPATRDTTLKSKRVHGVFLEPRFGLDEIKTKLKQGLKLAFDPHTEQAVGLQYIDRCYDGVYVAGTSFGKSLLIEGTAFLNPKKVILVICPLKALEYDQVASASTKGLKAVAINEDLTSKERKSIVRGVERGHFGLLYLSAELCLTSLITTLLAKPSFRKRLKAIFIDEAQVIARWAQKFREAYKFLGLLRSFTAENIPFVSLSATLTTETFTTVWETLLYSRRPFFGMDVGTTRSNLCYVVKRQPKTAPAVLGALSLVPATLHADSNAADVPKSLFYFETQAECIAAVQTVRRIVPSSLRSTMALPFSSIASPAMKTHTWDAYSSGPTRIVCATDAAGMGCNISDIEHCVVFDIKGPDSDSALTLDQLSQRWGRTGRQAGTTGLCVLYAPDYAFLPEPLPPEALPAVGRLKSGAAAKNKPKVESGRVTKQRSKIESKFIDFINLGRPGIRPATCAHEFFHCHFRPDTGLKTYHKLDMSDEPVIGWRAQKLPFDAIWIVLDFVPLPPKPCKRCWVCNPALLKLVEPISLDDTRFQTYRHEFVRSLPSMPKLGNDNDRAGSPAPSAASDSDSARSDALHTSVTAPITPRRRSRKDRRCVTDDSLAELQKRLLAWRTDFARSKGVLVSSKTVLPDAVLVAICKGASVMANIVDLSSRDLKHRVRWQLAREDELNGVLTVMKEWITTLLPVRTPPNTAGSSFYASDPYARSRTLCGTVTGRVTAAACSYTVAIAHTVAHALSHGYVLAWRLPSISHFTPPCMGFAAIGEPSSSLHTHPFAHIPTIDTYS